MDAEAAAPAEIHLVHIELQDLLLRESPFQLQRQHDLGKLSGVGLLLIEPEAARQLHRDRGCALLLTAFFDVDVCGLRHADRIEADVLIEALVLDRHESFHYMGGNFRVGNRPAFLAVAVEQICNQFRLEPVVIRRPVVGLGDDLRDAAPRNLHDCRVRLEIRIRSRGDLQAFGSPDVVPEFVRRIFGVPAAL